MYFNFSNLLEGNYGSSGSGGGCGDWMELAQDRDRWWSLVSTVMNLRVPKMWGIS